jgi:hypothetical protein
MIILNRLRLRDNWPLLAMIVVWFLAFQIHQGLIHRRSVFSDPQPGWTANYPKLLSEHTPGPSGVQYVLFILFSLILLWGFISQRSKSRLFIVLLVLLTNIGLCRTLSQTLFTDGTSLENIQTFYFGNHSYNLTRAHTLAGGADVSWSEYFVFKCDEAGVQCTLINSFMYDYAFDYTFIPAKLFVNNNENQLYIQFGDEQFLIDSASK